jgi:hypothetical protein
VTYSIDDFPQEHPNGLGLSLNHMVWQALRLQPARFHFNIRKPNNPYREAGRGDNVWDYFFDQPAPDEPTVPAPVEDPIDLALSGHRDWTLARQRVISAFARKHIRLQPEIQAEVDSFRRQHFNGKVLAISIRGTDKISEYQPMRADRLVAQVNALRERLRPDTLFLMTDDVFYHNLFGPMHPVSITIPRGSLSLHHNPPRGPYMSGLWACLDGWLAASATWFAYTPSNMATIPLIMGQHEEIIRLNAHCVIEPFCSRVDRVLGITPPAP